MSNKKNNNKLGFTLIELLVALSIISLLVTLSIASYARARNSSKTQKAIYDITEIEKAISILVNDTGYWPGPQTVNTLGGASICPDGCTFDLSSARAGIRQTDGNYPDWAGPYIAELPTDPWSSQYFFSTSYKVTSDNMPCAGGSPCVNAAVIGSYGPNKTGNGLYDSDDIIKVIYK